MRQLIRSRYRIGERDSHFGKLLSMMKNVPEDKFSLLNQVIALDLYEDHAEAWISWSPNDDIPSWDYDGMPLWNDDYDGRQELPLQEVREVLQDLLHNPYFFLTESNAVELIGKKVEFRAPSYSKNCPYHGIAVIKSVDFSKENPIECDCLSGDDLRYAFLDDYGLDTKDGGRTFYTTKHDFCFSYSDAGREVEVRVCE